MLGALVMGHGGMVQMLKGMGAKDVQAMASLYAEGVVDREHPNETYPSSPDWPRSTGTSSRKSSLATWAAGMTWTKWLSSVREGHTIQGAVLGSETLFSNSSFGASRRHFCSVDVAVVLVECTGLQCLNFVVYSNIVQYRNLVTLKMYWYSFLLRIFRFQSLGKRRALFFSCGRLDFFQQLRCDYQRYSNLEYGVGEFRNWVL